MNDDLQPLKNRLRWLNRAILALVVLVLLGLIAWAVIGLRKPQPSVSSTVIHPASSASNLATRAASAVAAATPKPAPSTAQQERAAAAAIDALSAASSPAAASHPAAQAPVAPMQTLTPQPVASAPPKVAAAATPLQAPTVLPASTASAAPQAAAKPKPTPRLQVKHPKPSAAHSAATAQPHKSRTPPVPPSTATPRSATVSVCRAAGWYVQLGAFSKTPSIDRLAQRLHRAGYTQVCLAPEEVRGLRLFYVGPYRTAAAARAARERLHALTGTEGMLRKRD